MRRSRSTSVTWAALVMIAAGCGAGGPAGGPAAPAAALPAPLGAVPVPGAEPVTEAKVRLGHQLFFDDRFSSNLSMSCATCHDPRIGWGDTDPISRAFEGTRHWRNAPTVVNAAYLSKLFWTGRAPTLQKQAHGAITGAIEMNGDPKQIAERLAAVPAYRPLFEAAFGDPSVTYERALDAIAAFERARAVSTDSPFDRHLRGEAGALSPAATRGLALFQGKAGCTQCHSGTLLTDQDLHVTGVPDHPTLQSDPLRAKTVREQHAASKVPPEISRQHPGDLGAYHDTRDPAHLRAFRTAPLRYLRFTAPYMHNGVFETLEEVVAFYDRGGGDASNKDARLRPLGLSADEQAELVAFLESCSGSRVVIPPPPPLPAAGD